MEIVIGLLLVVTVFGLVAYPSSRSSAARAEAIPDNLPFQLHLERPLDFTASFVLSDFEIFVKRFIDISGSAFGLIITSPLFIIIPLLIKLTSRGPVFYIQKRVGLNRRKGLADNTDFSSGDSIQFFGRRAKESPGGIFNLIKFRTMVLGAEKKCGPVWAVKNDPRITVIGKFLRKTRIDEIPQLINVLKGDMSLVGPRPERPFFVNDFVKKIPGYEVRYLVKPGITGLSQIKNGYDDSLESVRRKVQYDINYIKGWSIFRDLNIILKTVVVVFTTKGAL